jgi:putative glutamine amidotransferase
VAHSEHRPTVLVTAGVDNPRRLDLYLAGVEAAGGRPAVVRPGDSIPPFDALLLTGGPDVAPELYGQAADPMLGRVDRDRDALELDVLRRARAQGAPVLAICRGMQLVNVELGGTLRQHVEGHEQSPDPEIDKAAHGMAVKDGTHLAGVVDADAIDVNSFHHQVVDRLAAGLQVNATDEQGTVEGFESADGSILGIQCHPERMLGSDWAAAIFADLVARTQR